MAFLSAPSFMRRLSSTRLDHVDHFLDAAEHRVALLHGHNFLDVLDVVPQRIQFADRGLLVGDEMFGELGQMRRQVLAPGVSGNKGSQVVGVFLQQGHDAGEIGGPGLLHALHDQAGGNVDAVEHVADVVEDVGGYFRHPAQAGSFQQLFVEIIQFGLRSFGLGDVAHDGGQELKPSVGEICGQG